MADIALTTANRIEIVGIPNRQLTLPAGEAITAGAPVAQSSTGKFVNSDANSTTTALNRCDGIAARTVGTGESVTAVAEGDLDGFNFSSQAYGAKIYLSDTVGRVADGTGTTLTLALGVVKAVASNQVANAHNKIFSVNIPNS